MAIIIVLFAAGAVHATDTKARRGSLFGWTQPSRLWLAEPDGTLDASDRLSLMRQYGSDFSADDPVEGQKRGSLINMSFPGRPWSAWPDGTLSSTDRMSVMTYGSYQAPGAPAAGATIPVLLYQYEQRRRQE